MDRALFAEDMIWLLENCKGIYTHTSTKTKYKKRKLPKKSLNAIGKLIIVKMAILKLIYKFKTF